MEAGAGPRGLAGCRQAPCLPVRARQLGAQVLTLPSCGRRHGVFSFTCSFAPSILRPLEPSLDMSHGVLHSCLLLTPLVSSSCVTFWPCVRSVSTCLQVSMELSLPPSLPLQSLCYILELHTGWGVARMRGFLEAGGSHAPQCERGSEVLPVKPWESLAHLGSLGPFSVVEATQ